ncbi:type II toxin-antitoxin system RelE/ParE family toxin [Rhizobium sp. L1K21]|uniref:type II toxin-antitoxin system RelE/ParE family toxin n=1 Tax=Rhizobium sp. L1K21 TaxID=2954933 RepID=UPI002093C5C0|nr:type II toxin-antitoxin system RelE/ParE family toxin [Rhizobium sp. L1K21]MCO6186713.1 type II toxin-antitoxin system RelE/ParE family toxin [Rhizobium sp. L1K21]
MSEVMRPLKSLRWIGSSYEDYMEFPQAVHDTMGYAIHRVQEGKIPRHSKVLKGSQSGAVEIIDDHDGDTYRAVYTVKFAEVVYILHAFKKKSKKGIATPKSDLDLIRQRLRMAEEDYRTNAIKEPDVE